MKILAQTAVLREMYLKAKRERGGNLLVVALCDAGLALLDAEVAYSDSPTQQNAIAMAQASHRLEIAHIALDADNDRRAEDILRNHDERRIE